MATRTVLSDPRVSSRNTNWLYFYYDQKTPQGKDCIAIIPSSIKDIVKRGFQFEDEQLQFDPELRASVLTIDFHQPSQADPPLPPDRQTHWRDSDYQPPVADPEDVKSVMTRLDNLIHGNGQQQSHPTPPSMDPALQTLVDQACLAYQHAARRLGVVEKPRSMEAQKLITTCLIPWLRDRGVALTPDEERAMTL